MAQLLSDAVTVTARISPEGVRNREFGITLFLDHVTTDVATRDEAEFARGVHRFANLAAVTGTDGASDAAEEAAGIYFQQSPFPRNFMVGTVLAAAQSSRIFSASGLNVTDIEALGNNVSLTIDGNTFMANFDGLTTIAAIATALQTGLAGLTGYSAVTVAATGSVTDFSMVITGTTALSFGDGFTASTASATIGMSGDGVTVLANQAAAETVDDALDRIEGEDCAFFWVAVSEAIAAIPAAVDAVRDWVAGREFVVGTILDLYGTDVLAANEITSLGATLFAQGGNGIAAIWNGRNADQFDHKGLSYAGRFSSVNFDAPNAVPNGKFLQLPGTTARSLTASEKAELRRKRINYYIPVGTSGDTEEGRTFATWLDTYLYISWFKNALETAGYNYLKSASPLGGVPITDQGLAGVADAIEEVCETAVRNGMLAPNNVSAAFRDAIARATGNPDFDGFLSTGYLVVRPSAADVSQAVRNSRGPIPISVYGKGSGRVSSLEISVDFEA